MNYYQALVSFRSRFLLLTLVLVCFLNHQVFAKTKTASQYIHPTDLKIAKRIFEQNGIKWEDVDKEFNFKFNLVNDRFFPNHVKAERAKNIIL